MNINKTAMGISNAQAPSSTASTSQSKVTQHSAAVTTYLKDYFRQNKQCAQQEDELLKSNKTTSGAEKQISSNQAIEFEVKADGACFFRAALAHRDKDTSWLKSKSLTEMYEWVYENEALLLSAIKESFLLWVDIMGQAEANEIKTLLEITNFAEHYLHLSLGQKSMSLWRVETLISALSRFGVNISTENADGLIDSFFTVIATKLGVSIDPSQNAYLKRISGMSDSDYEEAVRQGLGEVVIDRGYHYHLIAPRNYFVAEATERLKTQKKDKVSSAAAEFESLKKELMFNADNEKSRDVLVNGEYKITIEDVTSNTELLIFKVKSKHHHDAKYRMLLAFNTENIGWLSNEATSSDDIANNLLGVTSEGGRADVQLKFKQTLAESLNIVFSAIGLEKDIDAIRLSKVMIHKYFRKGCFDTKEILQKLFQCDEYIKHKILLNGHKFDASKLQNIESIANLVDEEVDKKAGIKPVDIENYDTPKMVKDEKGVYGILAETGHFGERSQIKNTRYKKTIKPLVSRSEYLSAIANTYTTTTDCVNNYIKDQYNIAPKIPSKDAEQQAVKLDILISGMDLDDAKYHADENTPYVPESEKNAQRSSEQAEYHGLFPGADTPNSRPLSDEQDIFNAFYSDYYVAWAAKVNFNQEAPKFAAKKPENSEGTDKFVAPKERLLNANANMGPEQIPQLGTQFCTKVSRKIEPADSSPRPTFWDTNASINKGLLCVSAEIPRAEAPRIESKSEVQKAENAEKDDDKAGSSFLSFPSGNAAPVLLAHTGDKGSDDAKHTKSEYQIWVSGLVKYMLEIKNEEEGAKIRQKRAFGGHGKEVKGSPHDAMRFDVHAFDPLVYAGVYQDVTEALAKPLSNWGGKAQQYEGILTAIETATETKQVNKFTSDLLHSVQNALGEGSVEFRQGYRVYFRKNIEDINTRSQLYFDANVEGMFPDPTSGDKPFFQNICKDVDELNTKRNQVISLILAANANDVELDHFKMGMVFANLDLDGQAVAARTSLMVRAEFEAEYAKATAKSLSVVRRIKFELQGRLRSHKLDPSITELIHFRQFSIVAKSSSYDTARSGFCQLVSTSALLEMADNPLEGLSRFSKLLEKLNKLELDDPFIATRIAYGLGEANTFLQKGGVDPKRTVPAANLLDEIWSSSDGQRITIDAVGKKHAFSVGKIPLKGKHVAVVLDVNLGATVCYTKEQLSSALDMSKKSILRGSTYPNIKDSDYVVKITDFNADNIAHIKNHKIKVNGVELGYDLNADNLKYYQRSYEFSENDDWSDYFSKINKHSRLKVAKSSAAENRLYQESADSYRADFTQKLAAVSQSPIFWDADPYEAPIPVHKSDLTKGMDLESDRKSFRGNYFMPSEGDEAPPPVAPRGKRPSLSRPPPGRPPRGDRPPPIPDHAAPQPPPRSGGGGPPEVPRHGGARPDEAPGRPAKPGRPAGPKPGAPRADGQKPGSPELPPLNQEKPKKAFSRQAGIRRKAPAEGFPDEAVAKNVKTKDTHEQKFTTQPTRDQELGYQPNARRKGDVIAEVTVKTQGSKNPSLKAIGEALIERFTGGKGEASSNRKITLEISEAGVKAKTISSGIGVDEIPSSIKEAARRLGASNSALKRSAPEVSIEMGKMEKQLTSILNAEEIISKAEIRKIHIENRKLKQQISDLNNEINEFIKGKNIKPEEYLITRNPNTVGDDKTKASIYIQRRDGASTPIEIDFSDNPHLKTKYTTVTAEVETRFRQFKDGLGDMDELSVAIKNSKGSYSELSKIGKAYTKTLTSAGKVLQIYSMVNLVHQVQDMQAMNAAGQAGVSLSIVDMVIDTSANTAGIINYLAKSMGFISAGLSTLSRTLNSISQVTSMIINLAQIGLSAYAFHMAESQVEKELSAFYLSMSIIQTTMMLTSIAVCSKFPAAAPFFATAGYILTGVTMTVGAYIAAKRTTEILYSPFEEELEALKALLTDPNKVIEHGPDLITITSKLGYTKLIINVDGKVELTRKGVPFTTQTMDIIKKNIDTAYKIDSVMESHEERNYPYNQWDFRSGTEKAKMFYGISDRLKKGYDDPVDTSKLNLRDDRNSLNTAKGLIGGVSEATDSRGKTYLQTNIIFEKTYQRQEKNAQCLMGTKTDETPQIVAGETEKNIVIAGHPIVPSYKSNFFKLKQHAAVGVFVQYSPQSTQVKKFLDTCSADNRLKGNIWKVKDHQFVAQRLRNTRDNANPKYTPYIGKVGIVQTPICEAYSYDGDEIPRLEHLNGNQKCYEFYPTVMKSDVYNVPTSVKLEFEQPDYELRSGGDTPFMYHFIPDSFMAAVKSQVINDPKKIKEKENSEFIRTYYNDLSKEQRDAMGKGGIFSQYYEMDKEEQYFTYGIGKEKSFIVDDHNLNSASSTYHIKLIADGQSCLNLYPGTQFEIVDYPDNVSGISKGNVNLFLARAHIEKFYGNDYSLKDLKINEVEMVGNSTFIKKEKNDNNDVTITFFPHQGKGPKDPSKPIVLTFLAAKQRPVILHINAALFANDPRKMTDATFTFNCNNKDGAEFKATINSASKVAFPNVLDASRELGLTTNGGPIPNELDVKSLAHRMGAAYHFEEGFSISSFDFTASLYHRSAANDFKLNAKPTDKGFIDPNAEFEGIGWFFKLAPFNENNPTIHTLKEGIIPKIWNKNAPERLKKIFRRMTYLDTSLIKYSDIPETQKIFFSPSQMVPILYFYDKETNLIIKQLADTEIIYEEPGFMEECKGGYAPRIVRWGTGEKQYLNINCKNLSLYFSKESSNTAFFGERSFAAIDLNAYASDYKKKKGTAQTGFWSSLGGFSALLDAEIENYKETNNIEAGSEKDRDILIKVLNGERSDFTLVNVRVMTEMAPANMFILVRKNGDKLIALLPHFDSLVSINDKNVVYFEKVYDYELSNEQKSKRDLLNKKRKENALSTLNLRRIRVIEHMKQESMESIISDYLMGYSEFLIRGKSVFAVEPNVMYAGQKGTSLIVNSVNYEKEEQHIVTDLQGVTYMFNYDLTSKRLLSVDNNCLKEMKVKIDNKKEIKSAFEQLQIQYGSAILPYTKLQQGQEVNEEGATKELDKGRKKLLSVYISNKGEVVYIPSMVYGEDKVTKLSEACVILTPESKLSKSKPILVQDPINKLIFEVTNFDNRQAKIQTMLKYNFIDADEDKLYLTVSPAFISMNEENIVLPNIPISDLILLPVEKSELTKPSLIECQLGNQVNSLTLVPPANSLYEMQTVNIITSDPNNVLLDSMTFTSSDGDIEATLVITTDVDLKSNPKTLYMSLPSFYNIEGAVLGGEQKKTINAVFEGKVSINGKSYSTAELDAIFKSAKNYNIKSSKPPKKNAISKDLIKPDFNSDSTPTQDYAQLRKNWARPTFSAKDKEEIKSLDENSIQAQTKIKVKACLKETQHMNPMIGVTHVDEINERLQSQYEEALNANVNLAWDSSNKTYEEVLNEWFDSIPTLFLISRSDDYWSTKHRTDFTVEGKSFKTDYLYIKYGLAQLFGVPKNAQGLIFRMYGSNGAQYYWSVDTSITFDPKEKQNGRSLFGVIVNERKNGKYFVDIEDESLADIWKKIRHMAYKATDRKPNMQGILRHMELRARLLGLIDPNQSMSSGHKPQ